MSDMFDKPNCPRCGHGHDPITNCPKESSFAAPAGSASGRPKDQQWIQEMCELVKNKMPANYSFVVFGFPHASSDRCYYASNATRDSAVAALKEWLKHAEHDYLKHEK